MVEVAVAMAGTTASASRTSRLGKVSNNQPGGMVMWVGSVTE